MNDTPVAPPGIYCHPYGGLRFNGTCLCTEYGTGVPSCDQTAVEVIPLFYNIVITLSAIIGTGYSLVLFWIVVLLANSFARKRGITLSTGILGFVLIGVVLRIVSSVMMFGRSSIQENIQVSYGVIIVLSSAACIAAFLLLVAFWFQVITMRAKIIQFKHTSRIIVVLCLLWTAVAVVLTFVTRQARSLYIGITLALLALSLTPMCVIIWRRLRAAEKAGGQSSLGKGVKMAQMITRHLVCMDISMYCTCILVFLSATRQSPRPLNRYEGAALTFGAELATIGVIVPFLQLLSRLATGSFLLEVKDFFERILSICGRPYHEKPLSAFISSKSASANSS